MENVYIHLDLQVIILNGVDKGNQCDIYVNCSTNSSFEKISVKRCRKILCNPAKWNNRQFIL